MRGGGNLAVAHAGGHQFCDLHLCLREPVGDDGPAQPDPPELIARPCNSQLGFKWLENRERLLERSIRSSGNCSRRSITGVNSSFKPANAISDSD